MRHRPLQPFRFPFSALIILCGLALWVFSFRRFLDGSNMLVHDAMAYCDHIQFYLSNITHGVYPLWDPGRDFGTVSEFYLRRIGEFNPLFWSISLLSTLGASDLVAYRMFLGLYFALGMVGFYLLGRRIFSDPRVPLAGMLMLMFSSLSSQPFESYVMLTLVPAIWFFYFLVRFCQQPGQLAMLGLTFCAMILAVTYIPFYFLTVLAIGGITFVLVYAHALKDLWRKVSRFVSAHKKFTGVNIVAFALSFLPGILWYLQSAQGEVLAPARHGGSPLANTASVPLERINEGGIVPSVLLDHMFTNLADMRMGDFYFPVFVFLVLALGAFVCASRKLVFLFIWLFVVLLISAADASPLHEFLYARVFFFKYFRNVQFFLWMAAMPLFVLCATEVLARFLDAVGRTRRRYLYVMYVVVAHALAVWFFRGQEAVISSTYLAIGASGLCFLSSCFPRIPAGVGIGLLFLAIVIQPMQANAYMTRLYMPNAQRPDYPYQRDMGLPETDFSVQDPNQNRTPYNPYFETKWAFVLKKLNFAALGRYVDARLLLYDRLAAMDDEHLDIGRIDHALASFENMAFIPLPQAKSLRMDNGLTPSARAQVLIKSSTEVQPLYFDANSWSIKTKLPGDKFLVYNGIYHSQWRATVDGKRVELARANVGFTGLWVPAGEHVVQLRFGSPWRYALGYFLVALFWGVFIGVIYLGLKRL